MEDTSSNNGTHQTPEVLTAREREAERYIRKAQEDLDQTKLKAKIESEFENQKHENRMAELTARQGHDKDRAMAIVGGIAQIFAGVIDTYERVEKSKRETIEARYKFILDLAKLDKDLAEAAILNEGSKVAQEAGEEGAKALMKSLSSALSNGSRV